MIDRRSQAGNGRLGFLLSAALLGVAVFAGFKIIPVRVTAYEFRDILREEARIAAVREGNQEVTQRILRRAKDLELPVDKKSVQVRRTSREMIVTASYDQPIDLKVFTYVYKFRAEERAPLF